jgi:hypothetical protein
MREMLLGFSVVLFLVFVYCFWLHVKKKRRLNNRNGDLKKPLKRDDYQLGIQHYQSINEDSPRKVRQAIKCFLRVLQQEDITVSHHPDVSNVDNEQSVYMLLQIKQQYPEIYQKVVGKKARMVERLYNCFHGSILSDLPVNDYGVSKEQWFSKVKPYVTQSDPVSILIAKFYLKQAASAGHPAAVELLKVMESLSLDNAERLTQCQRC